MEPTNIGHKTSVSTVQRGKLAVWRFKVETWVTTRSNFTAVLDIIGRGKNL